MDEWRELKAYSLAVLAPRLLCSTFFCYVLATTAFLFLFDEWRFAGDQKYREYVPLHTGAGRKFGGVQEFHGKMLGSVDAECEATDLEHGHTGYGSRIGLGTWRYRDSEGAGDICFGYHYPNSRYR